MIGQIITTFATSHCSGKILAFPNWYDGLLDPVTCAVVFTDLNDVWVVVANILQIVLQLAGILALAYLIYGGIRYTISRGEPENIKAAKKIISYAIIGLVLAILASTVTGIIASLFL